jgi:hypothetical protein
MQLDSSLYYGFFNFFLGHGFAVDGDLHQFVVESSNTDATAMIAKKLKRMAYDAFYKDHQLYLTAVGLKKIRPKKKQRSITDIFPKRIELTELQHWLNERAKASSAFSKAKLAYESANVRASTDWAFIQMLPSKDNHNVHGKRNFLPGLGTTKLCKLMACHIDTFFELLKLNPSDYPAI